MCAIRSRAAVGGLSCARGGLSCAVGGSPRIGGDLLVEGGFAVNLPECSSVKRKGLRRLRAAGASLPA